MNQLEMKTFKSAVKEGKVNIVKILLEEVNPSLDENFALRKAIKKRHNEIIDLLLEYDLLGPGYGEAIDDALCRDQTELALRLLEKVEDKEYYLVDAAYHGNLEVVKFILEGIKEPDVTTSFNEACDQDHKEVAEFLLPYVNKSFALDRAAWAGYTDMVEKLLKEGDPTHDKNSPLYGASLRGHLEVVKLLLEDKRVTPNGRPICSAAEFGHLDIVKLLIEKGADPSCNHNDPLRSAAAHGRYKVVKFLLQDTRVDPTDASNDAIQQAAKNGHAKVVEILLRDGRSDPGANSNYALVFASRHNYIEVVQLLLQDGRINVTPDILHWAKKNKRDGVVALLQNYI